jgi:hypothetical protein
MLPLPKIDEKINVHLQDMYAGLSSQINRLLDLEIELKEIQLILIKVALALLIVYVIANVLAVIGGVPDHNTNHPAASGL